MKMHGQFFAVLASGFVLVAASTTLFAPAPAMAQDDEESNRPSRQSQTLDPAVGRVIAPVYEEEIANELWDACIAKLQDLVNQRGSRFKPYDSAIVNQLLGQCYAGKEDYRNALRSFQRAVDSGGLPEDQVNGVRYVIAQLNFQLEDYNGAIRSLTEWINAGGTPDANAYYLLAAAHMSKEPADPRAARRPAEQAIQLREEARKGDHDLLNLIYSETNANAERGQLLEKMINIWPGERSYWTQLSGLYNTTGKDKDAFSVLEVAYRAGLLEKEGEILTLVQYYSFFDNPYRGAELLEREMNAGVVNRNVKNLKLLSQLWSQSREHKRAIPVLEQAAGLSDDGELYYRLGQVLIADEQYAKGEQAMARARAKGGLTSRQVGDSWMLTGTARFSRAAENRSRRNEARAAFVNAARYDCCRSQAQNWVSYIDAINDTEDAQDRLACQQAEEEREASIDRLQQQLQVCRLQGGASAECAAIEERLITERTTPPEACVNIRGGSDSGEDAAVDEENADADGEAGAVRTDDADTEEDEASVEGAVVEQDG